MFDYLDRLRQKPRHVRSLYAFWIALVFTGVVGFFWLLSLQDMFVTAPDVATEITQTESSFWSQAKELFMSVRGIPTAFDGTIEYTQDTQPSDTPTRPQTLDLNALIASSSAQNIVPTPTTTPTTTNTQ
jgi:cytoskeletal protein RodZ